MKRICLFFVSNAGELVLATLLSALIWLLYTGSYKGFLHPNFWPFLLLGALIIVVSLLAVADQGMGTHAFSRKVTGSEQATLSAILSSTTEKSNTGKENGLLKLPDIIRGCSNSKAGR